MQKKITALVSILCLLASMSMFAQDSAKPATKAKVTTSKAAPAQKTTEIKMPKVPKIDNKVWNFLPEVVATVGKTKITKKELIRALNPQVRMQIMMGKKIKPEQYKVLAKNMTEELVKANILEELAASAGYKVTPELENQVYTKFLANIKKQMPKGKTFDFEKVIKEQGLTIEQVKKQMAEGETIQQWIKAKVAPEIKVTDAQAKTFYTANKDKYFKTPETVTASHILFKPATTKKDGKAISKDSIKTAKVKADKVFKEIKDGANFAAMAKKYSEGPSAKNGGSLGTFQENQMVPAFSKEAWKLAKEKLPAVGMVETKFGWHIIEVTAYNPGGFMKLDAALTKQIQEQLKQEQLAKKLKDMISAEMKKINPVINVK
jgi:peptidyl-prolyl cis-trans isomerase C